MELFRIFPPFLRVIPLNKCDGSSKVISANSAYFSRFEMGHVKLFVRLIGSHAPSSVLDGF